MEKLEFTVKEGTETIEVLIGAAQKRPEPVKVVIDGLINAPYAYLEKRHDILEDCKCHLIVNESEGFLKLVLDEKSTYQDVISGALKENPDYTKFGINTGFQRTCFELAHFIKMHRFFFANKDVAMQLVSKLKNLKANIKKEIEASDDNRGNTRMLHDQVLDSNIPDSFDICVPLFKGQKPQTIKVEINIQSDNLACSLISPDAQDLINEVKKEMIDKQLELIKALVPGLAILEV